MSNKLKLRISNVSDDWKESIIEDMLQEIRQQKADMADNLRRYGRTFQTEYSISYLREIVHANVEDYTRHSLDSIESCFQCLVDNTICLFFDYEHQDMPFFNWTSNCFDGRFCEENYAERVMYFSNFINHDIQNGIHMNYIYTSNMNLKKHTRILSNLSFRTDSNSKGCETTDGYITELKRMGNRINSMSRSENDYYKLDCIMNGMYNDNSYNQDYYLKTFISLELILLEPNQNINEIDKLLIPYLDKKHGEISNGVAKLLGQVRSKIGHGDFKDLSEKTEEFAQELMKHSHFDYAEYSRLNRVLLHARCLLDDLLGIIIFQQLEVTKQLLFYRAITYFNYSLSIFTERT